MKIKTEKKSDNKLTHSVWGIERPTPEGSLKEIKKLMDEKSIKLDDKWWKLLNDENCDIIFWYYMFIYKYIFNLN